jgi:5-methylcytosine-specific restriction endonuclease McrA
MPLFAKRKSFVRSGAATGRMQIVRDSYHQKNKGKTWWQIADEVRKRDGNCCTECKITEKQAQAQQGKGLQVHHIKKLSGGGRTVMSNLATLCERCHSKRHAHMRH